VRDVTLAGSIVVAGSGRGAAAGGVLALAGRYEDGTLRVTKDIVNGGHVNDVFDVETLLAGCRLVVDPGVRIEARPAPSAGGGTRMDLVGKKSIEIGAGAAFLAGTGGRIVTRHQSDVTPIIGAGAIFDPARIDEPSLTGPIADELRCGAAAP